MTFRSSISSSALVLATLATIGCSSEQGEVKLGVSVAALESQDVPNAAELRADADLDIARVRILVNVVKVGYAGGHDDAGDDASIGPIVVELSKDELANGAARSFDLGTLDSGTYGGAEIEIDQLSADADTSAAELSDFASEKASLLIDGSYKGTAFHFAGHFLAEQGTDGDVDIDAAEPVSLDLGIDPSSWFIDADGVVLDPTDAAQHDAIALAICKSLDTQPQLGGNKNGPKDHCVE